ncbi:ribonuclease H-like domain-containing protein, partial [Patescibacteria group bacterium]
MIVVLDVETKKSFSELEKMDPKKLEVSLVGILVKEKEKENYHSFLENELEKLWPLLEKANLIVGFNIIGFDYPVLSPYYSGDLFQLPTLDILDEFKKQAGYRISLDKIAKSTLGIQKIGDGLKAIDLFKKGKIEELKKYCLKDV